MLNQDYFESIVKMSDKDMEIAEKIAGLILDEKESFYRKYGTQPLNLILGGSYASYLVGKHLGYRAIAEFKMLGMNVICDRNNETRIECI